MSIQAVAWALDQHIPDPHQKLILISLANHASHVTGLCFPGLAVIAKEASCDRRTVMRRLPQLEAAGFISITRGSQGGQKLRNTYRLLIEGSVHQTLPPSVSQALPSVPQTLPPSVHQTLPPSVHQTLRSVCVDTRGSDSVVTTNNLHSTIKNPARARPSAKRVEPGRVGPEVLQTAIAQRLGCGDAATGWLLLGALSESDRDQLTAQQRNERLSEPSIDAARSKAMRALITDEERV